MQDSTEQNKRLDTATRQGDCSKNILGGRSLLICLILVGVVSFGLVLRIFYLREIINNPDFSFPLIDAAFNDYWARSLASGDWTLPEGFDDPEIRSSVYFRSPGYPFFLAFVYFLSGGSYLAARIIQMGLGLVNCVLAYLLGKNLFGRISGLIFAAFMSVYGIFIYFEGELVEVVLLVTLGLLLIYVFCIWYDRFTFRWAFAGGVFLGLFALIRPNVLLFGPAVVVWFWWVRRRRAGDNSKRVGIAWLGFVVGAVLVIAPVTVRNYIVARDFVLVTSNAGVNLYIGNNEESNGITPRIPILREITGMDEWGTFDYPKIVRGVEALENRKMKHSEVSSYFAKKAIGYILKHPAKTLKLMAKKAALFWGPVESPNNKLVHYEKLNSPTLRHTPGFPVVVSFAVVGLIQLFLSWKEKREQDKTIPSATKRQFEISVLILLFIFIYFISFLPFFISERFRVPIIPFLLMFGAYGLFRIGRLVVVSRDFLAVVFWTIICAGLYMTARVPVASYEPDLSRWHFLRGGAYQRAGQSGFAIEQYRQTIRLSPDFAKAHSALARELAEQEKYDEAINYYSKALRLKPDYPEVYENMGIIFFKQKDFKKAVYNWDKALQLRADWPKLLNNLAWVKLAYKDEDFYDPDEAVRLAQRACELTDYRNPRMLNTLSEAYAATGKNYEAVQTAEKALNLARLTGFEDMIGKIEENLELYRRHSEQ